MFRVLVSANLIRKCTLLFPKVGFAIGVASTVGGGIGLGANLPRLMDTIRKTSIYMDNCKAHIGMSVCRVPADGTVHAPGCEEACESVMYTLEMCDHDIRLARGKCWKDCLKLVLPWATMTVAGVTISTAVVVKLTHMVSGLAAELAATIQMHELYRQRTATWVGPENEKLISQGYSKQMVETAIETPDGETVVTTTEEIVKDEKLQTPEESCLIFYFDRNCDGWTDKKSTNVFQLKNIEMEIDAMRARYGVVTGADIVRRMGGTGRRIHEAHLAVGSIFSPTEPFDLHIDEGEWFGENGAEFRVVLPLMPLVGQLDAYNKIVDNEQEEYMDRMINGGFLKGGAHVQTV